MTKTSFFGLLKKLTWTNIRGNGHMTSSTYKCSDLGIVSPHQFSQPYPPINPHLRISVLGLFFCKKSASERPRGPPNGKYEYFWSDFFLIIRSKCTDSGEFAKDSRCNSKMPTFGFWRVSPHQFLPAPYPESEKKCFFGKIEFETFFLNF